MLVLPSVQSAWQRCNSYQWRIQGFLDGGTKLTTGFGSETYDLAKFPLTAARKWELGRRGCPYTFWYPNKLLQYTRCATLYNSRILKAK